MPRKRTGATIRVEKCIDNDNTVIICKTNSLPTALGGAIEIANDRAMAKTMEMILTLRIVYGFKTVHVEINDERLMSQYLSNKFKFTVK